MEKIGEINSPLKPGISNVFVKIGNNENVFALLQENSVSLISLKGKTLNRELHWKKIGIFKVTSM